MDAVQFQPGNLVRARGREWVVLPEKRADLLKLRPLGGAEDDATLIYLPLEPEPPVAAQFELPDPAKPGSGETALLLRDALRLKLRAGAGPFRSFGHLNVTPRAYQLVPLLMALKLDTVRLLVADDVGIGKTIEAALIARELADRGEIDRLTVICPPHLCEQWQSELAAKFSLEAEVVRTGTATRLERGLRPDESIFEAYPYTVVSLDYVKSDRRRNEFLRACPEFVIVDEAHTCVQSNTRTRHQRYRLLKGLAEGEPQRHMVFLTATPHSGDDTAFHNLLGLLEPRFAQLAALPEGEARTALRERLAGHFVQRRRGDIAEWNDATAFPVRERREAVYQLTGAEAELFDAILAYARDMVEQAEQGTKFQQRMSWWAALALLRCASSSPAAAALALRTRLKAAEGPTEDERIASLDQMAGETVLDEVLDDALTLNESVPAGTLISHEDSHALKRFIGQADALRGPDRDPKLRLLIRESRKLIRDEFRPVIFCRYIATAHYVGEALRAALPARRVCVDVITGELTPDQRRERVEAFGNLDEGIAPVLVATDCLSEGINLQDHFNAVVHYDLNWNPTRHEQREGRADRFGQASPTVRTLMLYGKNNPVDGAVLRVILDKAERIRKELGVAVPLPADNNHVVETIMKAVLLQTGSIAGALEQQRLEFADIETEVDDAWQTARDRASRTVFAQRRLRPDEVLPEWNKVVSVLGGEDDVTRFVHTACERLGAPLAPHAGYWRLPVGHLPQPLQDRLDGLGVTPATKVSFTLPAPAGATHIHRAHPLVSVLADYVAEQALESDQPRIGARATALFTRGVQTRTALYLLRLRSQLQVERRGEDGTFAPLKSLLVEECLGVAVRGGNEVAPMTETEALALLSLEPGRNMVEGQKMHLLKQELARIPSLESAFDDIARRRARGTLEDHRRIREASDARGLRYAVTPALPVDKIGIYVFMPMANL